MKKRTDSNFKGVRFHSVTGKWRGFYERRHKITFLKDPRDFDTAEEAALAVDLARIRASGIVRVHRDLNFPERFQSDYEAALEEIRVRNAVVATATEAGLRASPIPEIADADILSAAQLGEDPNLTACRWFVHPDSIRERQTQLLERQQALLGVRKATFTFQAIGDHVRDSAKCGEEPLHISTRLGIGLKAVRDFLTK